MKIDQAIFYSSIAKYYNQIFPLNENQVQFVKTSLGSLDGKNILDIGCSTGQLAMKLASAGAQITAIDLNEEMIKIAEKENHFPGLSFQVGNMLETGTFSTESSLDAVLCFGNTLVHLDSIDEIAQFFKAVAKALKPGGRFMIQILNYDYILDHEVEELPLIDTPKISFIRKYDLPTEDEEKVIFNTELVIKNSRDSLFHASRLLPIRKDDLNALLKHYGFERMVYYANFQKKPYGGNHLPLIVTAERSAS
ncbi:class I SAM-dependent methyltransferase [Sunxiuqinia indica]|uniref:class I SAM-dependent methyltransferase n=1 Tax=Sunxiuqinia indica TaxID=2692584 RepID=UPI0013580693|nr:class I SAM-dependent methyltransferase [Sunxiuqinia indica]